MRRAVKIGLWVVVLLAVAGLGIFFFVLPAQVEAALNGVLQPPPYAASKAAADLHRSIQVADLHADPLLWGRDLLERGTRGHVDIPRLDEGNVALQVFSVVSKSPSNLNIERNDDRSTTSRCWRSASAGRSVHGSASKSVRSTSPSGCTGWRLPRKTSSC